MRVVELLLTAALALALTINIDNTVASPSVEGYMGPVELGGGLFAKYKVRPADFCVVVNASDVSIVNFSVRCSAGILVVNSHNVTVAHGVLAGNPALPVHLRGAGIYVYNSTAVVIRNVKIEAFHDGIYVERSAYVKIENVSVSNSRYGIHIMFSSNVEVTGVTASGNYVGAAVMYTHNAAVWRSAFTRNVNWAEGYGLFIADVSNGTFTYNNSTGNIHGIYILVMGSRAHVVISNNLIAENYVGFTYRGVSSGEVHIVNNTFVGNSIPALYVDIFLTGGELRARISGNMWQGHSSPNPYVYRSAFAEVLAKTEFLTAPMSASPARFLVESFAVGNVAFIDPSPRPYEAPPATWTAAALALALLWLLTRRR